MKRSLFLLLSASLLAGFAFAQQPPPPEALLPYPAGLTVFKDLAYVPGGHDRQKLDIYGPTEGRGPFPLFVWIHGGAW